MEMELISKLLIYLALIKFTISTGLVIYGRICRGIGLEKKILYYWKPISSVVLLRPGLF